MESNGGISGIEANRREERTAEDLERAAKSITQTTADKLHRAATALRQRSDGPESRLTRIAGVAAAKIDDAANYVEEATATRLREDAGMVIRNYPLQSLAVGVGFGFMASRFLRRGHS